MTQEFTIEESKGQFTMHVKTNNMYYKSNILVDENVASYLIESFNAKISNKINDTFYMYFSTYKDAELALEWVQSFYIAQKLTGSI